MKKRIIMFTVLIGTVYFASAQVGIGTYQPNPSSQLEIVSTNKGVLIPRIALTDATSYSPIVGTEINSLLIYNTTTNSEITPGYFYWSDSRWRKLISKEELPINIITWNETTSELYYVNEDGDIVSINISNINETTTTLTDNTLADGTFTYENENGDEVTVSIPAAVINNVEEIFNNTDVQEFFNTYITQEIQGNVSFNETTSEFYYVNEDGDLVTINLQEIIKDLETETTLTDNTLADGTFTYENENGDEVTVSIPAAVINNVEEIFNNTDVQEFFNTYITQEIQGNVSFNETTSEFYYVNEDGDLVTINLQEIIKDLETETTLTDNTLADGTFTYENENGDEVTVSIPAAVINNVEEIFNNTDVQEFFNTYITQEIQGNVSFNETTSEFYYVNEDGDVVTIDINNAVETETILTDNTVDDGTFTYENETGASVTVSIPDAITHNLEEIFNNTEVKDFFNTYITQEIQGNVSFNETTNEFYYVDENGDVVTIDINNAVETETILTDNTVDDGTFTYENETGASVTVSIPDAITHNLEEIFNNTEVKDFFNTYITQEIQGNVSFNETTNEFYYVDENGDVVTIDINNAVETETILTDNTVDDGTFTYENETGASVTVSIPDAITHNLEEIFNNTEVKDFFNTYITQEIQGNVSFNETTNEFYYVDENGDVVTVNLQEIIKDLETETTLTDNTLADGTFTYENENGDEVTVSIPAAVINNVEEIFNNTDVQEFFNTYITQEIQGNVSFNETTSEFYYVNEDGDVVTVNLQEIIKDLETETTVTPVAQSGELVGRTIATYTNEVPTTVDIKESVTKLNIVSETTPVLDEEGNPIPGQEMEVYTLVYTDEAGIEQLFNMNALVASGETLTSLNYNGATNDLIYTDEKQTQHFFNLIDLVGDAETLTTLSVNIDEKTLDYRDEDNITHYLNLAPIIQEPWYSVSTNTGATSNSENIYTQGWVGIGYTSPSSAPNEKLRVNGTITTVNNYYADYVFEDYFKGFSDIKSDYKFKSLEEVESFIKTHQHLPGITPIHKLEKTIDGYSFNVSELSIQLLEKTEELYLHTIEQNNQLNTQKAALEKQEKEIENLKEENKSLRDRLNKLELLINKS